jgi:hypothetical protein
MGQPVSDILTGMANHHLRAKTRAHVPGGGPQIEGLNDPLLVRGCR